MSAPPAFLANRLLAARPAEERAQRRPHRCLVALPAAGAS
jgi:hypothetical protein